jgi:predicted  nucleic acid-binding Zn-ribbon protein
MQIAIQTKNNRKMKDAKLKFEMKLDSLKDQLHEDLNPSREKLDKARLKIERLGSELSSATSSTEHWPDNVYELASEILVLNEVIRKGAELHGATETTVN